MKVQKIDEPIENLKLSELELGDLVAVGAEYRVYLGEVTTHFLRVDVPNRNLCYGKINRKHVSNAVYWNNENKAFRVKSPAVSRFSPSSVVGTIDLSREEKDMENMLLNLYAKETRRLGFEVVDAVAKLGSALPKVEWVFPGGALPPGIVTFNAISRYTVIPKNDGTWWLYREGMRRLLWEIESPDAIEEAVFYGKEIPIGKPLELDGTGFTELMAKEFSYEKRMAPRLL